MSQERQAPYKASIRKSFQKALANKGVANEILAAIMEMQAQMDVLLAKLDLDVGVADTDYESTISSGEEWDVDSER